ncbi:tetratricopeptide repeat protein [Parathermosynechococcus lividus]
MTTETSQPLSEVERQFEAAIARYKDGAPASELIPTFKEICQRAQKSSAAWTCLSWLYLLDDNPPSAYKAAQKAVKLNPEDPQARINLAIAMLEIGKKGVRPHIELAQTIVSTVAELRQEVLENFADGHQRKPEWPTLKRVQQWVLGG